MKNYSENNPGAAKLLVRVTVAAGMLDISKSNLYLLINQGIVPAIRVGKSLRIPIEWLHDWILKQPKASE